MKIKAIIIFLLLSYISVPTFAQQTNVEVTYVGNAGFLIQIGDKKILVDALFKGFAGDYILPEQIQEKLNNAQAPFDDVDLVLVTHAHGDHIDVNMVLQHMRNNPNAIFASTKQTVDALNARDTIDNFHERRIGFNPSKDKSDKKEVRGITVETFLFPHGPDSQIINIGFLISVNGITIFQTGDFDNEQYTFEEFRALQLPEKKIDLAFVQHYYLTDSPTERKFLEEGIGAKYILPIHYHFTTPKFDAAIVKENYPDAILFDKELASWKMPDKKEEFFNQTIVWKKLTSFPNKTSGAKPIVLNNEIYYIPSSYAPRSITSDFYKYDIPSDTWIKLANMPEAKGNLAVAEASGKIYAIGGGFTKTNYEYTPEKDTWQRLDSMPTARQHIDCGVVDHKIYVIGGITSFKNITKKNEMYDPETNSWLEKAPIPTLRNNPAIVTKDSLIYVIGGAGSDKSIWTTIATVECYNTKTDEWITKADMPISLFKPGAVVIDNKILVLGGQDQRGKSLSSALIYDIESDTWEKTSPLPKINCFAGYAAVGNKIYMIGGTTSAPDWTYYSDVYEGTIINSSDKKSGLKSQSTKDFPILKGDYLGQTPPGDVPVIFAPGIVSVNGRYEFAVSITPDLEEIYFTGKRKGENSSIYFSKRIDNKWTNPEKANLTKGKKGEMEAFVNSIGTKIYFTASDSKGVEIWQASRSGDWWSDAIKLDSPINDDMVFYSNPAENGDLFYRNVSKGKLYYAPNKNGKFPEIFEVGIEYGSHGFISPSQDFMLIDALKENDKTKDKDIHICFKTKDGTWTKPINLGSEVNSNFNETCPSITPDGKYLFFSRYNEDGGLPNIYWVSTNNIKKLKEKAMPEASPQKFTNLKGDYLGQTPPGNIPEVFASGIVSTDTTIEHGAPTFSPDGNEVFWQSNYRQRGKETQIFGMTMKRVGNTWKAPEISPYTSGPVFSPDGKRLYFLPFGKENGEENGPYYVEKKNNIWNEQICMNLLSRFPEIKYAYNYSVTQDGTFYFLGHAEGLGSMNDFGIYRMKLNAGEYSKPELLPSSINLGDGIMNWTPFIAPDESYLLFSSNRLNPDKDLGDIYICFRKSDGTWTEAINLGTNINSGKQERFPSVSPDGKYLFFTRWVVRGNEDVMWVSAKIIDRLRK